jgi:hypothetical protein
MLSHDTFGYPQDHLNFNISSLKNGAGKAGLHLSDIGKTNVRQQRTAKLDAPKSTEMQ